MFKCFSKTFQRPMRIEFPFRCIHGDKSNSVLSQEKRKCPPPFFFLYPSYHFISVSQENIFHILQKFYLLKICTEAWVITLCLGEQTNRYFRLIKSLFMKEHHLWDSSSPLFCLSHSNNIVI